MAREQTPFDPLDGAAIRAAIVTLDPAFAPSPQFVHPARARQGSVVSA